MMKPLSWILIAGILLAVFINAQDSISTQKHDDDNENEDDDCSPVNRTGHSYLLSPPPRASFSNSYMGCYTSINGSPSNCSVCDGKYGGNGSGMNSKRGDLISLSWPRNDNPGGFIRIAWAPSANSSSASAFEQYVQLYSCFEQGINCKPRNASTDLDDYNGFDGVCTLQIRVPAWLPRTTTRWTMQWMWFGGGNNAGQHYSCVDFKIPNSEVGFNASDYVNWPKFIGGDYQNTGNYCRYYNTNAVGVCTQSPCLNGDGKNHTSGVPIMQTRSPTVAPTNSPTAAPTLRPTTGAPTTKSPTLRPTTAAPTTKSPTSAPTNAPITAAPTTKSPTSAPTNAPTTGAPTTARPTTASPTNSPTTASPTTKTPTSAPVVPNPSTTAPTNAPTPSPTTGQPTNSPTTVAPTNAPTNAPTTAAPTNSPTNAPTTAEPTHVPTNAPTTAAPTNNPTNAPTTASPTDHPTPFPTFAPTSTPTHGGNGGGSGGGSGGHTDAPSLPTETPSQTPIPTRKPTESPSARTESTDPVYHQVSNSTMLAGLGVTWGFGALFGVCFGAVCARRVQRRHDTLVRTTTGHFVRQHSTDTEMSVSRYTTRKGSGGDETYINTATRSVKGVKQVGTSLSSASPLENRLMREVSGELSVTEVEHSRMIPPSVYSKGHAKPNLYIEDEDNSVRSEILDEPSNAPLSALSPLERRLKLEELKPITPMNDRKLNLNASFGSHHRMSFHLPEVEEDHEVVGAQTPPLRSPNRFDFMSPMERRMARERDEQEMKVVAAGAAADFEKSMSEDDSPRIILPGRSLAQLHDAVVKNMPFSPVQELKVEHNVAISPVEEEDIPPQYGDLKQVENAVPVQVVPQEPVKVEEVEPLAEIKVSPPAEDNHNDLENQADPNQVDNENKDDDANEAVKSAVSLTDLLAEAEDMDLIEEIKASVDAEARKLAQQRADAAVQPSPSVDEVSPLKAAEPEAEFLREEKRPSVDEALSPVSEAISAIEKKMLLQDSPPISANRKRSNGDVSENGNSRVPIQRQYVVSAAAPVEPARKRPAQVKSQRKGSFGEESPLEKNLQGKQSKVNKPKPSFGAETPLERRLNKN